MNEIAVHEPHHRPLVTWAIIANNKEAQLYLCHKIMLKVPLGGVNRHHYRGEKPSYELVPIADGALKADTIAGYEIGHDRRGTTSSSNSPTHNTYEPEGNTIEELKRRFIRTIVDKLRQARTKRLFDHLIVAASAPMIKNLKQQLGPDIRKCIAAQLSKDLTHYHGADLVTHLDEALAEAYGFGSLAATTPT